MTCRNASKAFGGSLLAVALIILVSTSACVPGGAKPGQRSGSAKNDYIDAHNHLFGVVQSRMGGEQRDYDGAVKTALEAMDDRNISQMIVMPPPYTVGQKGVDEYLAFLPAIKRYPGRFAFLGGGGTLNVLLMRAAGMGETPPEIKQQFERQARRIMDDGAVGFGEMATLHLSLGPGHPFEEAPPDHPLMLLLADLAAEYNVPVDIHMEAVIAEMPTPDRLNRSPNPVRLKPNIAAFERLLSHNRGAKIIWAHAGWCHTGQRTAGLCSDLLERHPNLYMSFKVGKDSLPETRPLTPDGTLKPEWAQLVARFPDRFFIGSDQFYMTPKAHKKMPSRQQGARSILAQLPPDLARKVGVANPIKIFGLKD